MYRLIDCSTWDDPWFADLDANGKLFFLYLITNRRSRTCGAFEVTVRQMVFETGLDASRINGWLAEWAPRVMWWPDHNVVWLRNFIRYQVYNEKMRINARKIIATLPAEIQREIVMAYPELEPREDAVSIPYPKGMDKETAAAAGTVIAAGTETAAANGVHPRAKPPPSHYIETLNGALPKLEKLFQQIDQDLFTPSWLHGVLVEAERAVGPLSRDQLGRGLNVAMKEMGRRMTSEKPPTSPRPYARKLIVDYLTEQRERNHAT